MDEFEYVSGAADKGYNRGIHIFAEARWRSDDSGAEWQRLSAQGAAQASVDTQAGGFVWVIEADLLQPVTDGPFMHWGIQSWWKFNPFKLQVRADANTRTVAASLENTNTNVVVSMKTPDSFLTGPVMQQAYPDGSVAQFALFTGWDLMTMSVGNAVSELFNGPLSQRNNP